jgi:hypothetical protein
MSPLQTSALSRTIEVPQNYKQTALEQQKRFLYGCIPSICVQLFARVIIPHPSTFQIVYSVSKCIYIYNFMTQ